MDLIEQVRSILPEKDVSEALDLVKYNEFGVSFELICTQLFEYNVEVSSDVYQKIDSVGRSMNLDERIWKVLASDLKFNNHLP